MAKTLRELVGIFIPNIKIKFPFVWDIDEIKNHFLFF